jgi:hypothetical protein
MRDLSSAKMVVVMTFAGKLRRRILPGGGNGGTFLVVLTIKKKANGSCGRIFWLNHLFHHMKTLKHAHMYMLKVIRASFNERLIWKD